MQILVKYILKCYFDLSKTNSSLLNVRIVILSNKLYMLFYFIYSINFIGIYNASLTPLCRPGNILFPLFNYFAFKLLIMLLEIDID